MVFDELYVPTRELVPIKKTGHQDFPWITRSSLKIARYAFLMYFCVHEIIAASGNPDTV